MPNAPLRLTLQLMPDVHPVSGRVHTNEQDELPFNGYVELMSLLEEIRRAARSCTRQPNEENRDEKDRAVV
jgi:hypothetical protein